MHLDMQSKKTRSAANLAQSTGTEQWYRHSINSTVLYTDGAQYVAGHWEVYCALDAIALIQPLRPECRRRISRSPSWF